MTLLFSVVAPLVAPLAENKASAVGTSWKWVNGQTIVDNENAPYIDDNPSDNTHLYFKQGTKLACPNNPVDEINGHDTSVDTIDIRGWTGDGSLPQSGHHIYFVIPADPNRYDTKCTLSRKTINITDTQNSVLTYNWIDKNLIRHFRMPVGDNSDMAYANRLENADYTYNPATKKYENRGADDCKSTITPDPNNPANAVFTDAFRDESGKCSPQDYRIRLALTANAKLDSSPATGGNNNSGNAKPPDSCETKSAANVMGWLVCGFINILDGAINEFDKQLQQLLIVDMTYFTDQHFVQTWGVIRNISLLVLVPVMLIMVIATALEIGPFDAYTVRKSLPRFLFAVFFIVASLPILKFVIQLSNVVETGLLGIISSAFGTDVQRITLQSMFKPEGGATVGVFSALVAGTAGIAIGAATGGITVGVVFSFALVTAAAALIAYLAFQIRIILIVGLTLIAPLAILPWIFAGNDKLWNMWKGTLTSLLIVGPVLMVLIGMGRVLADISPNWIFKLGFYVGVYFLILGVIRSFGGVMGTFLNGMNDKAKGFFNQQAKFRSNSRQQAWGKFRAGERGPGFVKKAGFTTGAFMEAEKKFRFAGSALRNGGRIARNKPKTGYYGEAIAQQHKLNELRYSQTERAKATQEDDGFMLQAQTYRNAAEARARMGADWGASKDDIDRSIAAVNATGGFSAARQNFATRQLARTGTGYQNIEQMHRTVARVAGNNQSMAADMLGEMNATTKGVGRHDLAAGFGNQLEMYKQAQDRGGYEAIVASGGNLLTDDEYRSAHLAAAKDVDAVTLLRDKKKGVENMAKALEQSFTISQKAASDSAARMNDPRLSPEEQAHAEKAYREHMAESARLSGHMGKIEQSGLYASVTNVDAAYDNALSSTSGIGKTQVQTIAHGQQILVPTDGRQGVNAAANATQIQVNPTTGRLEGTYMTRPKLDPSGKTYIDPNTGQLAVEIIVDPVTGRGMLAPNPTRSGEAAEMIRRHGTSGQGTNPNDPNFT